MGARLLSILLVVIGAIGLLLCIGGLVGIWLVNPPVTDAITTTAQTADSYLTLAGNTTLTAGDEIERLRVQLDAVSMRVQGMTAETRAAAVAEVSTTVQNQIGPSVSALRTTLLALRTGAVALNQSLESANRIPGVNLPTFTDELQAAEQKLDVASRQVSAIRASLADVTVDGHTIEGTIASLSGELASIEQLLDQWSTQIGAISSRIATASDAAPGLIDLTSVVVSVLLILFGAGQVCLIRRGLARLRAA